MDCGLINQVEKTVAEYNMVEKNDSVLAGVSGGADSVALIHILKEIARRFSLKIGIAHLNHSLRGKESDKDAEFVALISDKLRLPCFMKKTDVIEYKTENSLSVEEAGRRVRYSFFEETAQKEGYNRIALGHTSDDNAELVLMYLIRGSGPLGLSGIPPIRPGTRSGLTVIRPLIRTTRGEILDYISENNISYVTDRTNEDQRYLRNRIRHTLIPELKKVYNPKVVETLNRLSSIIRHEEEWIEKEIRNILNGITILKEENSITLSVKDLNALHPAAKRRAIRTALAGAKGDLRRISFSHVEIVSEKTGENMVDWSLDLPDRMRVSRAGNGLVIKKEERALREISSEKRNKARSSYEYPLSGPGPVNAEKEGFKILFSEIKDEPLEDIKHSGPGLAFFDMEKVSFPLVIRNILPGDRFKPLGMTGSKKVSKYLINKKIPEKIRHKLPVVLSGGRIIWLPGYVIDDSVKVTANTGKILKAELFLA
jgi:tRNA(Ile)-lysidine synthase